MSDSVKSLKAIAMRETVLLLSLLFAGLFLVPLSIYLVGESVFGEHGGGGFSGFYGSLHREIRDGHPVVWFLVLSPYIVWQLFRLTIWAFRKSGR